MFTAPKPPPERFGAEAYTQYLRAYEMYVKAYIETNKVDAKVAKAKLYKPTTSSQGERGGSVHTSGATPVVGAPKVAGTALRSVPPPLPPRRQTQPVAQAQASASTATVASGKKPKAGPAVKHSKNLRAERRVLAGKLAHMAVSKRFPDVDKRPDRTALLTKAHRQFWPKARIVPGNILPRVFAALKDASRADDAFRFVVLLTIERINEGGLVRPDGTFAL